MLIKSILKKYIDVKTDDYGFGSIDNFGESGLRNILSEIFEILKEISYRRSGERTYLEIKDKNNRIEFKYFVDMMIIIYNKDKLLNMSLKDEEIKECYFKLLKSQGNSENLIDRMFYYLYCNKTIEYFFQIIYNQILYSVYNCENTEWIEFLFQNTEIQNIYNLNNFKYIFSKDIINLQLLYLDYYPHSDMTNSIKIQNLLREILMKDIEKDFIFYIFESDISKDYLKSFKIEMYNLIDKVYENEEKFDKIKYSKDNNFLFIDKELVKKYFTNKKQYKKYMNEWISIVKKY